MRQNIQLRTLFFVILCLAGLALTCFPAFNNIQNQNPTIGNKSQYLYEDITNITGYNISSEEANI